MPEPWVVVWRTSAYRDLLSLHDWIAADDPQAAQRLVMKIQSSAMRLSETPRIGSPFACLSELEVRQFVIKPYRMFYQVQDRTRAVVILRVWHGARHDPAARDLFPRQE